MMAKRHAWFAIAAITIVAWGCASRALGEEAIYEKASALTKVSSALEAAVYFDEPPEGLRDRALLEMATQHDPGLLRPFDGFILKADHHMGHGVVVVCDATGEQALLQDLGCTAAIDDHLWQTPKREPCAVSKAATQTCPAPTR